jgi:hypothetical protein
MSDEGRSYDFRKLRELLVEGFTRDTLASFCLVYPRFRPALDGLGANYSKAELVDAVMEYCGTQLLWEELLDGVKKENPRQYERLGPYRLPSPPPPSPPPPLPPPPEERRLTPKVLVPAAIGVLVLAGLFLALYAVSQWQADGPPPVEESSGGWCDGFEEGTLKDGRWERGWGDQTHIYVEDGVLNFRVDAEDTADIDSLWSNLNALPSGKAVQEISYYTALSWYDGDVSAGSGPEIIMEDDREHGVKVGPGPNGPEFEFYICDSLPCGDDYHNYEHPPGGRFPIGEPVPMRVVWTGQQIEFYVDGDLYVQYPAEGTPITRWGFGMYADKGSAFQVTVDDVCVVYVD